MPHAESLSRPEIERRQGERLTRLLLDIYGRNAFYTAKLDAAGVRPDRLELLRDLAELPMTTKQELVADQGPTRRGRRDRAARALGRYCQTSSTTGFLAGHQRELQWGPLLAGVYRAARVTAADRIFFPFSFGPFLGFWSAFDAGRELGALCVPGGGMSSHLRLAAIDAVGATVLCCTPTYALRLAEVAAEQGGVVEGSGKTLAETTVRVIIVAGEPGGSIPATRARIEQVWGARVIDHHGLTEAGPVSFECWEQPGGLHLNEAEFVCEVIDPRTGAAVPDGSPGELVVTNLGRTASPILRYRTRDMVTRRSDPCPCGRTWARLHGGILARADDMVAVRGVNVYPAAIEDIVRQFAEVGEFRSVVGWHGAMRSLAIDIEVARSAADPAGLAHRVAHAIREALGLNVPVTPVQPGTLPRYEMKARRFVVEG
jgi:phenylacetate-CoA ligase